MQNRFITFLLLTLCSPSSADAQSPVKGTFTKANVILGIDRDTISSELDEYSHPAHADIILTITNLSNDTITIPPARANFQHVLVLSKHFNRKELEAIAVDDLIIPQWQTLPPGMSASILVDVSGPFFKLNPGKINIRLLPLIYKYKKDNDGSRPIEDEISVAPKKITLKVLPHRAVDTP
jgi:hypothetical protein